MFRTVFFFVTFVPWTLFIIFTGVPVSFISPNYLHTYSRFWAKVGLLLAGVRLRVTGQEHLHPSQAVIYMANHQSNFDILALFAGLPGQFRWLAKEELFHVPLFGFAMRRCGYIPLNRSDRKKALHTMNEAAQRIRDGASVAVFPEGTRTLDGNLQPFKKGGFVLAFKAGVPIQPIVIHGSYQVMSKTGFRIHGGIIEVQILPAIATEGLNHGDREKLIETVHTHIAEELQAA